MRRRITTLVSIVSIQTDQSRPFRLSQMRTGITRGFNRINPNRSIPTKHIYFPKVNENWFQSYQSKQINPDIISADISVAESWSFNRINPNRSIPTWKTYPKRKEALRAFQSYQSRQINPDMIIEHGRRMMFITFQSYQSKQINPDKLMQNILTCLRGVSIVSIQTDQSRPYQGVKPWKQRLSFNRINPNRSIPTRVGTIICIC